MKLAMRYTSMATNAPFSPNCSSIQEHIDKTESCLATLEIDDLSEITKFIVI